MLYRIVFHQLGVDKSIRSKYRGLSINIIGQALESVCFSECMHVFIPCLCLRQPSFASPNVSSIK